MIMTSPVWIVVALLHFYSIVHHLDSISAQIIEDELQHEEPVTLQLEIGKVEGRKVVTKRGTHACVFQGIPYAEAPVGENRYAQTVPFKAWNGTRKGNAYGPMCASFDVKRDWPMSEDCLLLNVFTTPKCMNRKDCPVVFYTYGGMWKGGHPYFRGDVAFLVDNWQSEDIVLITYTYRLGLLGYFTTRHKSSAVRNAAMLDKLEALKWVHRELLNIGGDKNKVSLMGHSSGSIDSDLMSLSPAFQGMFSKLVLLSGPAGMHHWLNKDHNTGPSLTLANSAGCAITEQDWDAGIGIEDTMKCLRGKPYQLLTEIAEAYEEIIAPVIDVEDCNLLPQPLDQLLKHRTPMRMMAGTTSREFLRSYSTVDQNGNVNDTALLMWCLIASASERYNHPLEVALACREDYKKRPSDIRDIFDDWFIYVPNYDTVQAMKSTGATVYLYSFEYAEVGAAYAGRPQAVEQPFHAQDAAYVMGLHRGPFTEKDEQIRRIYTRVFTNFVKTDHPTPSVGGGIRQSWKSLGNQNNYFKIDFDEDLTVPGNTIGYHQAAINFWRVTAPALDLSLDKYGGKHQNTNWKAIISDLATEQNKDGVEFSASHQITLDQLNHKQDGRNEEVDKKQLRSLLAFMVGKVAETELPIEQMKQDRIFSTALLEQAVASLMTLTNGVEFESASQLNSTNGQESARIRQNGEAPCNSLPVVLLLLLNVVVVIALMSTCLMWRKQKKLA